MATRDTRAKSARRRPRRMARVAQGCQRKETDVCGHLVQSQEQPNAGARGASLRRCQALMGYRKTRYRGLRKNSGAGLYAVCAGEFLHGAQEIDSCRGIGMPGRPGWRRPGGENATISTIQSWVWCKIAP